VNLQKKIQHNTNEDHAELIYNNIAVNSSTSSEVILKEDGTYECLGNKTECALLIYLSKHTQKTAAERKASFEIFQQFGFKSEKKRMNTIVYKDKESGDLRMFTKGAPEMIIDKCSKYMVNDGSTAELTEEIKSQLLTIITNYANNGLRTLALSFKDYHPDTLEQTSEPDETDSILLSIFGIKDPLRPEVKASVQACIDAGIIVRMVTGDNVMTAKSIARQCGILNDKDDDQIALIGPDFSKMTDDEIDSKIDRIRVIARCSPMDKTRLVKRLIYHGEVVAVTGDGTNDAPALKAADVGLAMGIRGTDVAKSASDIVILDDNFYSIVKSVMWGRSVYDNIRKFLQFQLTVNVVALSLSIIGSISGRGAPLKALQMLWVNLIMDTMAALALGTEKPSMDLLKRKPFGRFDSLISLIMLRNIVGQMLYQLAVLLVLMYSAMYWPYLHIPCAYINVSQDYPGKLFKCKDGTYHTSVDVDDQTTVLQTMIFNTFVFLQVFNEVNSRRVNGEHNVFQNIHKNWIFLAIVAITVVVQTVIIVVSGPVFDITYPPGIGWQHWLTCLLFASFTLIWGQIIFFIPVPKTKPKKFKSKDSGFMAKIKRVLCCKKGDSYEEIEPKQGLLSENEVEQEAPTN